MGVCLGVLGGGGDASGPSGDDGAVGGKGGDSGRSSPLFGRGRLAGGESLPVGAGWWLGCPVGLMMAGVCGVVGAAGWALGWGWGGGAAARVAS